MPLHPGKGYDVVLVGPWFLADVAANRAEAAIDLCGVTTGAARHFQMLRDGWVTGMCIRMSSDTAGGTLSGVLSIDGARVGAFALSVLGAQRSKSSTTLAPQFVAAGSVVGVNVSTDSSYTPVTNDVTIYLEIMMLRGNVPGL